MLCREKRPSARRGPRETSVTRNLLIVSDPIMVYLDRQPGVRSAMMHRAACVNREIGVDTKGRRAGPNGTILPLPPEIQQNNYVISADADINYDLINVVSGEMPDQNRYIRI